MSLAIKVENIGKAYQLGTFNKKSLWQDLATGFKKSEEDLFWAVRNINFEVEEGEVLGLIGKNGAGKSTMLKLLSRITSPTEGNFKVNGTMASLLEVGTGFHPELTGRENIFLNGAILGMAEREIKRKFDEIVDFSGVEKFIDTPVKRYSSGMYVRLAFSVAAHLEPKVLIVDEVLAVGDAEFQKKCLGKMKDVSGEGRTVLFVSHSMVAVENLCTRALLLQKGQVTANGNVKEVISKYYETDASARADDSDSEMRIEGGDRGVTYRGASVVMPEGKGFLDVLDDVNLKFEFDVADKGQSLNVCFNLHSIRGEHIINGISPSMKVEGDKLVGRCTIPGGLLNYGIYVVTSVLVIKDRAESLIKVDDCLSFELVDKRENEVYFGKIGGLLRTDLNWKVSDQN